MELSWGFPALLLPSSELQDDARLKRQDSLDEDTFGMSLLCLCSSKTLTLSKILELGWDTLGVWIEDESWEALLWDEAEIFEILTGSSAPFMAVLVPLWAFWNGWVWRNGEASLVIKSNWPLKWGWLWEMLHYDKVKIIEWQRESNQNGQTQHAPKNTLNLKDFNSNTKHVCSKKATANIIKTWCKWSQRKVEIKKTHKMATINEE